MQFEKLDKYKILRNSFTENMCYAYNTILGDHNIVGLMEGYTTEGSSYGIADIMLFPIAAQVMIDYGSNKRYDSQADENKISSLVKTVSFFLGIFLELPRIAFSLALTIVIMPLIAIVNILKYPYVTHLQSDFYELVGENYSSDANEYPSKIEEEEINLTKYVNLTDSTLGNLDFDDDRITSCAEKNNRIGAYGEYKGNKFTISSDRSSVKSLRAARKLGFFVNPNKTEVTQEVLTAIPYAPKEICELIISYT